MTSISILFLIVEHGKAVSAEVTGSCWGCCGAIAPEAGDAALTEERKELEEPHMENSSDW